MSATAVLMITLLLALLLLALALLVGALAILIRPTAVQDESGGVERALSALNLRWQVERGIYRHHRAFGLVVVATAVFLAWRFLHANVLDVAAGTAWQAAAWALLAGQLLNLAIGIVLLIRPSLLKPLESAANRWHSIEPDGRLRGLSVRASAAVIALVGLVGLLGSLILLGQRLGLIAA